MNLLFVCKYNRFRSKTAEAYFKKINKNKNIHVKSAGLFKGSPINVKTNISLSVAKELGIIIKDPTRGISSKLLQWQNMLIIVANNVPPTLFNNKRYGKPLVVWKIKDTDSKDKKIIRSIIIKIMKRVDKLVEDLKTTK